MSRFRSSFSPQSPLRPCLNCGTEFPRDAVSCTNCGANRGLVPQAKRESASTPSIVEVGEGNRSGLSLGELHEAFCKGRLAEPARPDRIGALVPELTELAAFFYEDAVRRGRALDFGAWKDAFERTAGAEIATMALPYSYEIYCRGKALFIGAELIDAGVDRFKRWNRNLLDRLIEEERKVVKPFSRQICDLSRQLVRPGSAKGASLQMVKRQRRVVFAGIAAILLMLLIPPWKRSSDSSAGYHFVFAPPVYAKNIDGARLVVQCMFVVLLGGAITFVLRAKDE